MNNDLISREALKEEVVKLCELINANYGINIPTLAFTRTIDNAPTVKSYTLEDLEKAKNNGYKWGRTDGKKERPQGEWNYIQAGMCVCPFCGAMPHKEYKNFCANCGAKMKGGES